MMKKLKCSIEFPEEFTDEERELKSKYRILRKLKIELSSIQKKEILKEEPDTFESAYRSNEITQDRLKKNAAEILKASGGAKKTHNSGKETKDFKRASKQFGEMRVGQRRCAMGEYTPESESQPRSVIVRGHNLTYQELQKTFDEIGDIWKIRIDQDNQSAIVTFKNYESACLAVDTFQGKFIEGKQLIVELMKKRNTTWTEISTADAKNKKHKYDSRGRDKCTVHVSYNGKLTMQDMRSIFNNVGKIEKIYISSLNHTSTSTKPFAFVTFEYEDEAVRAVDEKHGTVFNGILLKVSPQKVVFNDSSVSQNLPQEKDSRNIVSFDYEVF
ncbi:uncharacterized protein TNIN_113361 [Trichonephila inaurata madagascariensis]|uniref:Negative elongation factor E n=1 Tax=Trichonephila inaurata madagascariensis TaxID=2747483 RepID=A0A8X7BU73_9ARAC|nr:uncharacterized protein TNIN_113361 [Trichonephila inaurata madagascariensis]